MALPGILLRWSIDPSAISDIDRRELAVTAVPWIDPKRFGLSSASGSIAQVVEPGPASGQDQSIAGHTAMIFCRVNGRMLGIPVDELIGPADPAGATTCLPAALLDRFDVTAADALGAQA